MKNKALFFGVLTNWRLALLGATGLVLSLASGWTTWDGMRNFTNEPILSLMITFGIQGVMLIVAWLIGESFATSIGRRQQEGRQPLILRLLIVAIWLVLFVLLGLLLALLLGFDVEALIGLKLSRVQSSYNGEYLLVGILLALFTLPILSAGKDIIEKYQQAARVIARNLSLWLMFLACMGASVFFSFDSLFTAIFPHNERVRAADIRIRSQVAAISASITDLSTRRRLEARTRFLASTEWEGYSRNLDRLVVVLRKSPGQVDRYLLDQSRISQKSGAQREEELAVLRGKSSQLLERKIQLSERVSELKNQTGQLNGVVKSLNAQVFAKNREIIIKTSQTRAEETGIGGTLQAGRGPKYRALAEQLQRLKGQKNNLQAQLRAYNRQLSNGRKELGAGEGDLARIDARLSKLRGQTQLIGEGSAILQHSKLAVLFKVRMNQSYKQLNSERIAFEQSPSRGGLAGLQSRCAKITDLLTGSPFLKVSLSSRLCDPGKAHEAAANLYALNRGSSTLAKSCANQSSATTVSAGSIEQKLGIAHKCLRLSGLSAVDRAIVGDKIGAFERNRDDKAHRFVVSINAFKDGNKLAYLALAIAFAIDSLVFVSGLFGANVLRSPLSSIPQGEGRTARQLDRMIENALLPDVYANATLALQEIKPVRDSSLEGDQSVWTHELDLHARPHVADEALRKLVNAGAIIGSVKRASNHMEKYYIRGELIEALSDMAMHAFEGGYEVSQMGDLKRAVLKSLGPDAASNAQIVLPYLRPSTSKSGFSSMLKLSDVRGEDEAIMRQCLNAASTFDAIEVVGNRETPDHILIGKEFYKILAELTESAYRAPPSRSASNWSPPPIHQAQIHEAVTAGQDQAQDEAVAAAETAQDAAAAAPETTGAETTGAETTAGENEAEPKGAATPAVGAPSDTKMVRDAAPVTQSRQSTLSGAQIVAASLAATNENAAPLADHDAAARSSETGAAADAPDPAALIPAQSAAPTFTPVPAPASAGNFPETRPASASDKTAIDKPDSKPEVKPVSGEPKKKHRATITNDTIIFD